MKKSGGSDLALIYINGVNKENSRQIWATWLQSKLLKSNPKINSFINSNFY